MHARYITTTTISARQSSVTRPARSNLQATGLAEPRAPPGGSRQIDPVIQERSLVRMARSPHQLINKALGCIRIKLILPAGAETDRASASVLVLVAKPITMMLRAGFERHNYAGEPQITQTLSV